MVTRATVLDGGIVLPHRLELPDGTPVLVVAGDTQIDLPTQDLQTTISRLRRFAVPVALPDDAFSSESLYEI